MVYLPSEGPLTALEPVNKALENVGLIVDVISEAGANVASKELSDQQDGDFREQDSGYASKESSNAPSPAFQHNKTFIVPASEIDHVKQGFFKKKLRRYDRTFSGREHKRFADLKILLGLTLSEYLQGKKVTFSGAIQLKLLVMGEDEASARPFIVVACQRHLVKPVKQFFKQRDIIGELQPLDPSEVRFEVVVREQVQLLSNNGTILVWPRRVASCENVHRLKYVNGLPITAWVNGQGVMATLGGLITITYSNGACRTYGLTAGHVFRNGSTGGESGNDIEAATANPCQQHESRPASPFSQASLDMVVPNLGDGAVFDTYNDNYEIEGLDTLADLTEDILVENTIHDGLPQLGFIDESLTINATDDYRHTQRENRDWALIRPYNEIHGFPAGWPENISKTRDDLRLSTNENALSIGQVREVCIARPTGIGEIGFLSRSESSIMISPGDSFSDIYTLSLHPPAGNVLPTCFLKIELTFSTELQAGDSGAWVYDATSGEVYGHIVGQGLFGEGLVMPMHAILSDMRQYHGAVDIKIPKGAVNPDPPESPVNLQKSFSPSILDEKPDSGYASMENSPQPHEYAEIMTPDSGYGSADTTPRPSPPQTSLMATGYPYMMNEDLYAAQPNVSVRHSRESTGKILTLPLFDRMTEMEAPMTSKPKKRKRDRFLMFIKFRRG
ncbi:hypothetical protein H2198_000647 [Neophaeococcomyces mojaviensis]|uniref:Uncharacterized protein n=1 Tax=Neophaeococcomyces mojaviensis TaxID=3383035 RepID=A0ACC3AK13_9EURO|nr:hypothetical protein H2198_000647 [Knufia sp. JES_112]